MGLDVSTERSREMALQCCCACMQGGGNRAAEKHGEKKDHEQNPTAPQEGVRHKASGRRGNGTERKGQTRDRGWRKKKIIATKNSTNNGG